MPAAFQINIAMICQVVVSFLVFAMRGQIVRSFYFGAADTDPAVVLVMW